MKSCKIFPVLIFAIIICFSCKKSEETYSKKVTQTETSEFTDDIKAYYFQVLDSATFFIKKLDTLNTLKINQNYFLESRKSSGIYNLGTGEAESFNTLGKAVFSALEMDEKISYIPTPKDIRDKYQYYTKAEMQKVRNAGYLKPFYDLKSGAEEYVKEYLTKKAYF